MSSTKKINKLKPEVLLNFYYTMNKIRLFEIKLKEMFQLDKVGGSAHLSTGQEASATGVCLATKNGDQILSTHRGHGHLIAKGADIKKMFAEIFGRSTGYCFGKGGSMHIADPSIDIFGANGIVGGSLTTATGFGLANKLLKNNKVCICFFGDGAAAQGGLYESLNLCKIWNLPVLYVCENNQYALSNPPTKALATESIAHIAKLFNLDAHRVDGNDIIEVYETAQNVIEKIRNSGKGGILECITYRREGHYCGDPCVYRDDEEVKHWADTNDPIKNFKQYLLKNKVVEAKKLSDIEAEVREEINKASQDALLDPEPELDVAQKDVYVDLWSNHDIESPPIDENSAESTYREAVFRALDEELARDERVIILGEDIGKHGGAFQATRGLYDKYGPDRVRDTPISEAAIGGCTLGAGMAGLRPVGEFQYSDFMTLAMDQIANQAAKIHYMFGGHISAPLVYRAPCGSGGRGNAAQHSQSLESWFMHIPGLKVVMPSTPFDLIGLLKTSIRDEDPVIFLEHKALYNNKGFVPKEEYLLPFGRADIKHIGDNITIIATSRMVLYSLEAAERLAKEGISVEVVDPRTLVPLDKDTICNSVAKTGYGIVVSEDCLTCSVTSEIASVINEEVFDELDGPVVRLAALDVPIPYNRRLERYAVPSVDSIYTEIKRVLGVGS